MQTNLKNKKGITFIEVIFALPVALLSIFAAVAAILGAMGFNETARAYTQAMNLGIYRLEEIRNYATSDAASFQTNVLKYNGVRFPKYGIDDPTERNQLRGLGIDPSRTEALTRISMISSDLADVVVVVSYQDKSGRVIGEDKNFNGVLNVGEDANGNSVLDSPIAFHALVARK